MHIAGTGCGFSASFRSCALLLLLVVAGCGSDDGQRATQPTVLLQPADLTVTEGSRAEFTGAIGAQGSMALQWRRNGQAIAGANAPSYVIAAAALADNGATFDLVGTNAAGTVTTRAARLTVNPLVPPPTISTQPTDSTVVPGVTATFTVVAAGTGLTYQWQRGGTNIVGATAATYTTPAASPADDGATFRVVVTNPTGSVTSTAATLRVIAPPTITTPPADAGVTVGNTATFSVVASGTGLSYQWQRGTTDVAGATSASYTTPATVIGDDGATFRVVVTNAAGAVTSSAATLTVTDPTPPSTFRTTPMVVGTDGSGIALKADGTVWAWGSNLYGELGDGSFNPSPTPVQVKTAVGTLERIVKISASRTHVVALDADGFVWAWGTADALGVGAPGVANIDQVSFAAQVRVDGNPAGGGLLSDVADVAAGHGVSIAARRDGTVVTWGSDAMGAMGNGVVAPTTVLYPRDVVGLSGIVQVAAGDNRAFARTSEGIVRAWGDNTVGALGDGTVTTRATPVQMSGVAAAVKVAGGPISTQVILADGTGRLAGRTRYNAETPGVFNAGNCAEQVYVTARSVARPPGIASTFTTAVAIGGAELFVFGGRLYEVGDVPSDGLTGVCTRGLTEFADVANVAGVAPTWGEFTHVWTSDGRVYGLGRNDGGQLGIGNLTPDAGARELVGFNLLGLPPSGTQVLSVDFESPLPTAISAGTATVVGVQGFAGLGATGNQFGGSFLRSATGNVVTVTLTNLPAHSSVNLAFLFAAIDSLDGAGAFPAGDFFKITLDGQTIFREAFSNATTTQVQTYLSPPGVELARRVDLGFAGPGSFFTDSAYDMGRDPQFQRIPHTASTLTLTFSIEGAGIQNINDESWAIDNLQISVNP